MSAPLPAAAGLVTLVAVGPGDLDLMPVRAMRALQEAQLVIADAEVAGIAEQLTTAEVVSAIDATGLPLAQAARARVVGKAAREGKSVVRLFAGDPVFDGSFSREAEALTKAGIDFDLVPGISAVTGAAAYAGIGLTNSQASAVHAVDAAGEIEDWGAHSGSHVTLVALRGAPRAAEIAGELLACGRDPKTPALIAWDSTTLHQRTLVTTLGELPGAVLSAEQSGNGILIVGPAAARNTELSWFEGRSLFGWRVLLPKTKAGHEELVLGLERLGARVTEVQTISVEPPRTPQQMDKAVRGLVGGRFEWVVFTSANSVKAVWEKCDEYGVDARALAGVRIAASGSGTVTALQQMGIRPDLAVADGESSSDLLELFPEYDERSYPFNRVLLPRADIATETLVSGLTALGWEAEEVTAYRAVRSAPPAVEIRDAIKSGDFDAVVFTSAATVRNLVGLAGKPHANTLVFCAGPKTAKAAEEHGLVPKFIAAEPTIPAMLESLSEAGADLRDAALEVGDHTWRPTLRRTAPRRKAN